MRLITVDKREGLDQETFRKEYLESMTPVVFKDLSASWPARNKWTFDFFKKKYGHLKVPVVDRSYSEGGKNYMHSCGEMKFGDYLDLIQREPTDLRIFLWNILKDVPELRKDISCPDIMDGFLKELPFMFFGGQGSYTKIHYDIDCSHVFLTQFQTRKRVLLFSQDMSKYLYHLPFTVTCLVDPIEIDEDKYPSIKNLVGYETVLEHGETLFIPSMYWHHIEYTDGGFSIAYRASNHLTLKLRGAFNLTRHLVVDRGMNVLLGSRWMDMKKNMARRRAGHTV